ncbi:MAG: hypothetical protein ABJA81_11050, partial [Nocardioidaceae bacterium]
MTTSAPFLRTESPTWCPGPVRSFAPPDKKTSPQSAPSTLHYLDLLFYDNRLVCRVIDQGGRLV